MTSLKSVALEYIGADTDVRVRQILDYACTYFEIINVSPWHVCRIFKTSFGLSPARCIKLLQVSALNSMSKHAITNTKIAQQLKTGQQQVKRMLSAYRCVLRKTRIAKTH